jgi:hypothetical protein
MRDPPAHASNVSAVEGIVKVKYKESKVWLYT